MWMCDPTIMCYLHLLGEHVECHMFIGTLKMNKSIKGYLKNNCFEPKSLIKRHDILAEEIERRGWKHKSPIKESEYIYINSLPDEERFWLINKRLALIELLNRCSKCRTLFDLKISFKKPYGWLL